MTRRFLVAASAVAELEGLPTVASRREATTLVSEIAVEPDRPSDRIHAGATRRRRRGPLTVIYDLSDGAVVVLGFTLRRPVPSG